MHIFDGEFFYDCTVLVFKKDKEYDVFISCNIPYNFKVPKCRLHDIKDLKTFIKNNNKLIGFSNQYFDNPVLEKIIRGMYKPEDIYEYSQSLIKSKDRFRRDYWDNQLSFSYLDLLKINHYDNPARATSLKKLEFNYRRKKIADLPFHHSKAVTKENQLESIVRYCIEDVDTTEISFEKTKPLIALRQEIYEIYKSEFLEFNPMNMNDGAIGEALNLFHYCQLSGKERNSVKSYIPRYPSMTIHFKDCIPEYIDYKSLELKQFLNDLKNISVNSTKEFSKKIQVCDLIISLGQGGLHSEDSERIVRADSDFILLDADISGQYPSEIIKRGLFPRHLSEHWYKNAEEKYYQRVNLYKPNAKTDKKAAAMSDVIKAMLNSALYGKTNSEYSWQFDPLVTMKTTLGCQTEILMLVEDLYLKNIKTISINTDGILCHFEREKLETYHQVLKEWKEKVGNTTLGDFEFTEYDFIAQLSVNDYIAKTISGGIKRKGKNCPIYW